MSEFTGRYYITTAIPYVNAAPHLGHALEFVQADVLARHRRLRGQAVRFLSGTDDHALKNVSAAQRAGLDVEAFVAAGADQFAAQRDVLGLSYDDFIRTSSDPRHRVGVERLWRQCAANGDFYLARYEGWYCEGCEQFYTADELDDGRCSEHARAVEHVVEENWFFRLSRYAGAIERALTEGRVVVNPVQKRNEVLSFVRSGLADFSVSRPVARANGWGIPVPQDPSQIIYVWWDALANYVTALGYGDPGSADYSLWWPGAGERVHVIGKGISRFHAVYWIALLLSAGQILPTTIHVHDYLNLGGRKLSKSSGAVLAPSTVVQTYGVDALRWWFTRDVPLLGDTDYDEQRLIDAYNTDLANGLGNLVHRTLSLVIDRLDGSIDPTSSSVVEAAGYSSAALDRAVAALPGRIDGALHVADFRAATAAIAATVDAANRLLSDAEPWKLPADQTGHAQLRRLLARVVQACRALAYEISPFIPAGAALLGRQLGDGDRVTPPVAVFPRLGV